ncbi:MAG: hypothetical protein CMJ42_05230 [Phyllobacteriaceae bacterium]|nr:hypothetical protein [Phyllobacteriaceae bacterium]MBA91222.1 hypothetical protein [Phyllobacteriaceae bacterium]
MGGYGSGGWNASGRPTTADVPCLNVIRLHRLGLLTGNHEGTLRWHTHWLDEAADFVVHGDHIRVIHGTVPSRYCDEISIEWEDCRFGGRRPFFVCPYCSRRTLHLYRNARLQMPDMPWVELPVAARARQRSGSAPRQQDPCAAGGRSGLDQYSTAAEGHALAHL